MRELGFSASPSSADFYVVYLYEHASEASLGAVIKRMSDRLSGRGFSIRSGNTQKRKGVLASNNDIYMFY